jgi:ribonucleoside-diphosphate reductase alpha chain
MSDISRRIWDMKYRLKAADGTPLEREPADSLARVALAAAGADLSLEGWRREAAHSEAPCETLSASFGPRATLGN